ncbi:hypothetical protein ABZ924_09865 [Streptomyces sp. NPDC046876]|uniref:SCO4225 family membrane protein n=1 Tax=Streptomyces sp. NPDC046876 TaxID=3155616 RepID=UPI0033FC0D0E
MANAFPHNPDTRWAVLWPKPENVRYLVTDSMEFADPFQRPADGYDGLPKSYSRRTMRPGLRTFVRLTFGNWWSGTYLALVAFFLLFGFGVNGSYVAGLLGGLLGMPTIFVLFGVAGSLGSWARTGTVTVFLVVAAYTFQAFMIGLLVRRVRSKWQRSGGVRSGSPGGAG